METKRLTLVFLLLLVFSVFPLNQIKEVRTQEQETNSFGNQTTPSPKNWSKFWSLFNQYSEWDLEYNNGSGWISDKSQLQVIKNYTVSYVLENGTILRFPSVKNESDSVKITLNFTASYSADYRLTFGISLDVKNYTYKTGAWNYTLSYKNYTVYFDWTDIKDLPLDSVTHGIKPFNDDSYFWFRIRKNNIQQGKNTVIDPVFGDTTIHGTHAGLIEDKKRGVRFQLSDDNANVTEISFYSHVLTSGTAVTRAGIYNDTGATYPEPDALMGNSSEVTITTTSQWWNYSLGSGILLDSGFYWLTILPKEPGVAQPNVIMFHRNGSDVDYVNQTMQNDDEYDDGFANPFGVITVWRNWTVSIFATYDIISVGQDLTFNLFENLLIYGSSSRGIELGRSMFQTLQLYSSSSMGREYGFNLFETLSFFSGSGRGLELSFRLFDEAQMFSSVTELIEVSGLNLVFILFDNVRIWTSTDSVFEGIGQDLTFILFETVNLFGGLVETLEVSAEYVLNDALLLAGFAVILAFVAIGLVFLARKES